MFGTKEKLQQLNNGIDQSDNCRYQCDYLDKPFFFSLPGGVLLLCSFSPFLFGHSYSFKKLACPQIAVPALNVHRGSIL
jgi:hypothetical protein